ncbi:MAG: hypothetical protein KDA25_13595 [Phycisphaerales bacterium]|nr:hypothetical protein [Phycisphaerales bacterium]
MTAISHRRPHSTAWSVWTLIATIAAVALLARTLQHRNPQAAPLPARPGGSDAPPVDPPALPILAIALNCHHIEELDRYLAAVDRIAETGADTLLVSTPLFQPDVHATTLRRPADRCPTDRQLRTILARAHARGLRTALMPIVLLEHPGPDDWRGVLAPTDWDAWWTAYERELQALLDLAIEAGVDLFFVGSELNSTELQVDRWVDLVTRIRTRYAGRLSYAANWDRYEAITFWPLVDLLSVSAYFELAADGATPSVGDLTASWDVERERLLAAAARFGRPVFLSELGYPSLPWAAAHPWNYVAPAGTRADHVMAARCYESFFASWGASLGSSGSGAGGVCVYLWDPYHRGGVSDTGYGLFGKPSLGVVRDGFASIRRSTGGVGASAAVD